jgi:hypothetical protein
MIWFLMNLAMAEILLLSEDLSKDAATELTTQCETLIDAQQLRSLEIRSSRFYISGQGYQYRVVIAGLDNRDSAVALQENLLTQNVSMTLQIDGQSESPSIAIQTTESSAPKIQDSTPTVVSVEQGDKKGESKYLGSRERPSVDDVVLHAQEAHQVLRDGWLKSTQEQFYFYRRLPQEGTNIHHRYYQQGKNLRLDITIKNGEGVNSTTVLPEDGEAWIQSSDKVIPGNAARTQELLTRFSSKNILSVPFNFAQDVSESEEWNAFTKVKREGDRWMLSGSRHEVLKAASFYRDTWLIAMVEVNNAGKTMTYEFTDYREIESLGSIPHIVQIFDEGQLVEEIQIESLTFIEAIPDSMFVKKDP